VQRPILVTGGAGFIGSHLVDRLLNDGESVVVLDNLATGSTENLATALQHPRFRLIQDAVSNHAALESLVANSSFVFHLAAAVGVERVLQNPIETIQINLKETEAVLEAAAIHKTPVLFTSTSEVYGRSDKPWFHEDDDLVIGPPTFSRWSYACSKLLDEFLALAFHRDRGLPITIVRLFNIVGPRQSGQYGMVLPRFVQAALREAPLRVHGEGRQTRCFCHVNDCVEALVRLRNQPSAVGQVINVGTDAEVTVLELARQVVALAGGRGQIECIPYAEAMGPDFQDMPRRRPDLRKLEQFTGFRPRTSLETIIRDLLPATFKSQS